MKLQVILWLMFNILVMIVTGQEIDREEILAETIPIYTIAMNAGLLQTGDCRRELKSFLKGVQQRQLWSLRILDASGVPKTGFLVGNNFWLGSSVSCNNIMDHTGLPYEPEYQKNVSRYRDVNQEYPPFDVHYFTAHFLHNSTLQYQASKPNKDVITLGLCLPASCTNSEVATILRNIVDERKLIFQRLYFTDLQLIEVRDLRYQLSDLHNATVILIGIFFMATVILVIIGTSYDIRTRLIKKKKQLAACENNNMCEMKCQSENEDETPVVINQGKWGKILQCFSIYENSLSTFSTKESRDTIPALHGFRVIGMMWIVAAHMALYGTLSYDNTTTSIKVTEWLGVQLFRNAFYSVDTFFFISAFLLTYTYLNKGNFDDRKRTKPISYRAMLSEFFTTLLKRYVRLTPTYFLFIGLTLANAIYLRKVSIFYELENTVESCTKYWWANILYVSNLFHRDQMCMSWSWYMGADMQFYVITLAALIFSTTHFYLVATILCSILLGSMIISAYVSYSIGYTFTLIGLYEHLEQLYFVPWVRIGPYIVGVAAAYLLVKWKRRLHLSKPMLCLCWCLGITCNLTLMFIFWRVKYTVLSTAIVFAVYRTLWAVGIGWVVIACATNNAGIVNKFLSFKGWIPLSKLTFGAYLLNPVIIQSMNATADAADSFSFYRTVILGSGTFMLSYFISYLLAMLAEVPYRRLMYLYLGNRNKAS